MSRLKGKSIVIIGGTSGLGLSAAKAFIREGARVVAVGLLQESVEQAREIFAGNGVAIQGDARDSATAISAIRQAEVKFGRFDGLYHVAGGSGRKMGDGPLHEMSDNGLNETMSLNFNSLVYSNRAAVQTFRANKQAGTILNMGSVLGFSPSPAHFATHAYAAAKAAIIGFTRATAAYYAKENIRINVLAPALVETPMAQRAAKDETIQHFIKSKQPLDGGRIGRPADYDEAAIFFMSDASRFTTGQVLSVDGGWDLSEGQYGE